MGYLVAIKPSAWRASAAVGEWVNRQGARRRFGSKALAREWARECASYGVRLWIQDAVPWDASPVDGYLVGVTREPRESARDERRQATLAGGESDDGPSST